jgi:hypothetical protein
MMQEQRNPAQFESTLRATDGKEGCGTREAIIVGGSGKLPSDLCSEAITGAGLNLLSWQSENFCREWGLARGSIARYAESG